MLLSYLLTDEAFAMTIRRYETQPHNPVMHYHLLGTGLCIMGLMADHNLSRPFAWGGHTVILRPRLCYSTDFYDNYRPHTYAGGHILLLFWYLASLFCSMISRGSLISSSRLLQACLPDIMTEYIGKNRGHNMIWFAIIISGLLTF